MKYLPLLFILFIIGCVDKNVKPDFEVIDNRITIDSSIFLVVDTSPFNMRYYSFVIQDTFARATRDSFGNWTIKGDCKRLLETTYQNAFRNMDYSNELRHIIDSLEAELIIIKANKAEYHYSKLKDWYSDKGIVRITDYFDTIALLDKGWKGMRKINKP